MTSAGLSETAAPGAIVAQVQGLSFAYAQRSLFGGWNARFPAGVTWITGDEGSGKTTLLRLLDGSLRADAGVLRIGTTRLDLDAAAYRAQVFRSDPQSELPAELPARDWLETVGAPYPQRDHAAIPVLIDRLGLREHLHKPLFMLSTGSRRKFWLVAAWSSGAALTLLDQPFAALDKTSIMAVCGLLQEQGAASGRAWVVADYTAPPDVALVQTLALD
jgi:ABC-type multidrug transport system ATPase subunit